MNKYYFLIITLIFNLLQIQSQKIDGICSEADLFGEPLDSEMFSYHKYRPILKLKKRYSNFAEVKNQTPEELLISQMSVQNNEWLKFNFNQKLEWKKEQFERVKNQDPDKNYIEIIRKVTYSLNNSEFAILRVKIYDDRKENPATLSLFATKKQNRWVLIRNQNKLSLEFFMMSLNLNYLDSLFEKSNVDNKSFNDLIQNSWTNNTFNPSFAHQNLGKLMLENDDNLASFFERNNPTISEADNFQDYSSDYRSDEIDIKTNFVVPLSNQMFCSYFLNNLSEFDGKISNVINYLKIVNTASDGSEPIIIPIHKFEYDKSGERILFIKYTTIQGDEAQNNAMALLKYDRNQFIPYENNSEIDENIISILNQAKTDLIIQLSNGEDDENFPEINMLKTDVQDANGVLNIALTKQLLTAKSSQLSKYLDK